MDPSGTPQKEGELDTTPSSTTESILSPDKSCGLDPKPTPLMKQCLLKLVPVITKIINFSLLSGIVPDAFKHATVTRLLKNAGLDVNKLKQNKKKSQ